MDYFEDMLEEARVHIGKPDRYYSEKRDTLWIHRYSSDKGFGTILTIDVTPKNYTEEKIEQHDVWINFTANTYTGQKTISKEYKGINAFDQDDVLHRTLHQLSRDLNNLMVTQQTQKYDTESLVFTERFLTKLARNRSKKRVIKNSKEWLGVETKIATTALKDPRYFDVVRCVIREEPIQQVVRGYIKKVSTQVVDKRKRINYISSFIRRRYLLNDTDAQLLASELMEEYSEFNM